MPYKKPQKRPLDPLLLKLDAPHVHDEPRPTKGGKLG